MRYKPSSLSSSSHPSSLSSLCGASQHTPTTKGADERTTPGGNSSRHEINEEDDKAGGGGAERRLQTVESSPRRLLDLQPA